VERFWLAVVVALTVLALLSLVMVARTLLKVL
jgi:hypothetical protein